jgi:hypothetical protein
MSDIKKAVEELVLVAEKLGVAILQIGLTKEQLVDYNKQCLTRVVLADSDEAKPSKLKTVVELVSLDQK